MILAFGAGLVIGTVGGMVSWLAAAAYFEARRTPVTMAEAGAEFSVFTVENSFAFSPEQTAPSGRLYRRPKTREYTIAPVATAAKSRSSSL
jgi:hypothetical protein